MAQEEIQAIDLEESARHTGAQLRFWLPLGRVVAAPLLALLGPVANFGAYRVPAKGGVLILANHVSDIDPVVVQACCPRPIHFMAKSELFGMRVIGRLLKAFGAYPVKRGLPDRAALRLAVKLLEKGEVVCLFPEGQLSEDGLLQEIKGGASMIVRMCPGIPVICCGLTGTQKIIPYGKVLPRPAFCRARVMWGEPKSFRKDDSADAILQWISSQLTQLTDQD